MQGLGNHGDRNAGLAASAGFALSLLALAMNAAHAAEPTYAQSSDAPVSAAAAQSASAVNGTGTTKKKSGVASLDRVTVQSARARRPEAISRAKQEVAPNIINTVTQEEARKLPDFNAGEAAARLPGVTAEIGTGQQRWIFIRGLDADLTSTTYAGIHLPPTNPVTPSGGGRAFAYDSFPVGMIGSLTVTKTNRPDQDAEALAGTIEITPKEIPANKDHFLEYRLGTGRRNERGTGVQDIALTAGTRFGFHTSTDDKSGVYSYSDKPFSIIGSFTYFHDQSGTDNRGASFYNKNGFPADSVSQMSQAYYRFHRTTIGGGAELAYQPDADNRWYARYLHSGYDEIVNRQQLIFKMSGTPTQNADGSVTSGVNFQKTGRNMDEQVSLDVFQLGGQNSIGGGAKIDYNVAYTEGKDYRPYDQLSTFSYNPKGATIRYNNQADLRYPSYAVTGANFLDPSMYNLSSVTNNPKTYLTQEWSGGTNVTLPTHFFSIASQEELKFGAYARFKTNFMGGSPYNSAAVPNLNLAQAIEGPPINFYDAHYANGYSIDLNKVKNLFADGAGAGFKGKSTDGISGLAQQTRNSEDVFAGYVQEQMTFGRLGLLGGLRVEETRATYGGYVSDKNLTMATPIASSNNYVNFFPSLQARYEFTNSLIGRASYSSTIARPGFNQASPAALIDPGTMSVIQGNPNLKPTTSNNFDLSLEQYLKDGGIVSLGVFDKEMSNYIVANTRTAMFGANDPFFGSLAGLPIQVVTFQNIAKARARGVEFDYDQHYTFLPGILSGLGSSFNYTYVDSNGQIRPGENGQLPETSRQSFNAQLYWENSRFSVHVAAQYRGKSLLAIGNSSATDQFTQGRLSLDVGASYAINKNLSVYVAGRNLLDTPLTVYQGSKNFVIQREMYGKTFLVGVSGKFE
jgi:TonB-dependent receptor